MAAGRSACPPRQRGIARDPSVPVTKSSSGIRGRVVGGLSLVAHVALLPKALQPFHDHYPQVHIQLIDDGHPTVGGRLKDGSVDFYVGPGPEEQLPAKLIHEALFESTRIILGRKGHPLVRAQSLDDLISAEWTTTSVTFEAEEELDALFAQHCLPRPRFAFRT